MASLLTELEVLTITFSLLVFALFTLTGMLNEECAHLNGLEIAAAILPVMDLPFSGFELTFIIVAFVIFSLFSLASVCIQPREGPPEKSVHEAKKSQPLKRKQRVILKEARRKP